ncbi:ankyrin repeat domain-containing protein [Candidatus Sulfurimonas marisnigri]|uniref:Ankyrin repeat domain-containing protein n=1 Tax=Candidatus Sulfurimonas marisnigri TaxID=2740405 RepID=A0A7S7RPH7_9BACT|nr:ankyrin repeat domain-containing protein [Candidatus Sulfurimonas marisnigri]QOY53548.1 ankyrin repeat domain-containing protein [Candidatus Sulfurimonas marisnigri]
MDKWIRFLKNNDYLGVKKHLRDGADVNDANEHEESVLAMSFRHHCDIDLIMLLIENGADIYDFDEEGVSIFEVAITYGNIEMVKYLISCGIDVNKAQRRSGFTPLMAAACYGRTEIIKLLMEKGADINAVDLKGLSVTDFARKMKKNSILELLRK